MMTSWNSPVQAEPGVVVGERGLSTSLKTIGPDPSVRGLLRLIGTVEAGTLEFDRNGGEDLADLFLTALRANGDRIVIKRLLLGEIVIAALATVMVSRHDILHIRP